MSRRDHFFDLTPDTLRIHVAAVGAPPFAVGQVLDWVYRKAATDFDAMTNLSTAHRAALADRIYFMDGAIVSHQRATDETQKLLVQWSDPDRDDEQPPATSQESKLHDASLPLLSTPADASRQTECVMIPAGERRTACISSQVGCPVGCAFCASGLGGLDRNLTVGRIVEQVFSLQQLSGVGRISNIVFMGMGEPLANYAAVTAAIRTLNAGWGFGIGARKITISTVGLPAAIRKLVNFDIPVTLALSLHAPNDAIRRQLIPWANYTTIAELLDACTEYFNKTGREITLEYILLRNVNDRPEHARQLASIAKTLRSNVNLIRYNEVRGLPFDRPASEDVHAFQAILREHGVNAHIRASRGRDIAAACGQLRHETATTT